MSAGPLSLAVVIPTYRREQVLVETVKAVLALEQPADEVLVIDETEEHESGTLQFLKQAEASGRLRWRRHRRPGQVSKLNRGLLEARSDIVLFLDDDVVPGPELVAAHAAAKGISLKEAPLNSPVPLHPGAAKYYREAGVLK